MSLKICSLFFLILSILLIPSSIFAKESDNSNITIVNPVRISQYTTDPPGALLSQYGEVSNRNLPASWLLTHDVLEDTSLMNVIKKMNQSQEIGLFLEITSKFATASGVLYNKTDSWHRSNSLFLSGYTQSDRIKLIDELFNTFKEKLGYYPTSVGAWWIDSYSLSYMQQKYGITAYLDCSDQFFTDGYQIWGQYWSTPFYPSKNHSAIPAKNTNNKLDIVVMQWAARDPLNGYLKSSLYSTQDYFTIDLKLDYFQKILELYSQKHSNQFGHIVLGLEADFSPQVYKGIFATQMELIKKLQEERNINVVNMKSFAETYKNLFPNTSPPQIIESNDLLGTNNKVIWYQSPYYRAGILVDNQKNETKIIDLRFYFDDFQEPYYITPNGQLNLSIYIPSIFDSVMHADSNLVVSKEKVIDTVSSNNEFKINYSNNKSVVFKQNQIVFENLAIKFPSIVTKNPTVLVENNFNKTTLSPKNKWPVGPQGFTFRNLTPEALSLLNTRKVKLSLITLSITILILFIFILKKRIKLEKKILLILVFLSIIIPILGNWYIKNSKVYLVNQSEIDSLIHLASLPRGKIIVPDNVCLQCSWQTQYPPAAFYNFREYVKTFSKKPIVYNSKIFQAKTREEGRKELNKLDAEYIYVTKIENYTEMLPFSPGDYNLDKIYENANSEVWKIRKNK